MFTNPSSWKNFGLLGTFLSMLTFPLSVDAVHKGAGDLTCGGCHTMHNSQGNTALEGAGGGSLILLRANVSGRENIHFLCLQCHSNQGAQADINQNPHGEVAPKVHNTDDNWTQDISLNTLGAGGNFFPEVQADFSLNPGDGSWAATTAAQGKGHSLGITNVTPPGGDMQIDGFSCTSCHDPHGTRLDNDPKVNRFRNLKVKTYKGGNNTGVIFNAGDFTSWIGGMNGTFVNGGNYAPAVSADGGSKVWPLFKGNLTGNPSNDAANSNSYGAGNKGISRWCAQCHDDWHEELTPGNYSGGGRGAMGDWNRHPVDNVLDEGNCSDGTEAGCSGAGVDIFDNSNYDPTVPGEVLPVASAAGLNRVFYISDASSDRVMCLSCHFAHGGPYNDNLRWDYTSAVGSGNQVGNPVPSNRGCQLCHNR